MADNEDFEIVNVDPMTAERTVLYRSPVRPVLRNGDSLTWTTTRIIGEANGRDGAAVERARVVAALRKAADHECQHGTSCVGGDALNLLADEIEATR